MLPIIANMPFQSQGMMDRMILISVPFVKKGTSKLLKLCNSYIFYMNLALFCRFKGAREIRDHFCAKQSDLAGNANFIEYRLCGPGSVEADFMENLGASDIYKYGMEQRVAVPGKFPFISAKNWRKSHLGQFGNYLYPLFIFFKKNRLDL